MNKDDDRNNVLMWFTEGKNWAFPVSVKEVQATDSRDVSESPIWDVIWKLLQQMKSAHLSNDTGAHWSISQKLDLLIKDNEDQNERGHIYLEWGVIEAQSGDYRDALLKLKSALELYAGKLEERATLLFMVGCIQWLLADHHNQAISTLGRAVKEFNLLKKRNVSNENGEKYKEIEKTIQTILQKLVDEEVFPPFPLPTTRTEANDKRQSSGSEAGSMQGEAPVDADFEDLFKVWPVLETVPAGGFINAVGEDPSPFADVYFPQVRINDEIFNIFSLKSAHTINLRSINDFFVVKVIGDSMNIAKPYGLLEGDFLFLKRQNYAEINDIVVVARQDVETRATVKRYVFLESKFAFRPDSDNPEHEPIFIDRETKYMIIGVAVAVFKKLSH
jgi:tetratricopeptide (TPR) repeat protein